MLRKLLVVAFGGVVAVVACQPEAFHDQAGITGGPGFAGTTGLAGTQGIAGTSGGAGIAIMTAGNNGTGVAGAVDTSGAAGAAGAPTGAAGMAGAMAGATGAAGAAGTPATGAGGTMVDAGTSMGGRAGTPDAGPRDLAPEAPPSVEYPQASLKVTASITAAGGNDASNVLDGKPGTRWTTGKAQVGGETFTIDLGKVETVSRVVLDDSANPTDFPAGYTVEVSTDGMNFMMATTGKGTPMATDIQLHVTTRYIRIRQTGTTPAGNGSWWSIDELRVYS
jgi:hypothetical protein